jgi:hypothetical protein
MCFVYASVDALQTYIYIYMSVYGKKLPILANSCE